MDIKFITKRPISKKLHERLNKEFGFEVELDCDDDGCCEYFFGYSQDGLEEGQEDPLPYDEAVRCCGVLWREGIQEFAIEGNGGWAMGMIRATDFDGYAVDDATKKEWKRISDIFWAEANVPKRATKGTP